MLVNWEVCTAKQSAEVFPATSVVDAGRTCNLSAKLIEDTFCMLVNRELCTTKQSAEVFPVTSVVGAGQTCNLIAEPAEDAL